MTVSDGSDGKDDLTPCIMEYMKIIEVECKGNLTDGTRKGIDYVEGWFTVKGIDRTQPDESMSFGITGDNFNVDFDA